MKSPGECKIALEDYCRSCRCFMTGEYCSKQESIRKERKLLHDKHCINVFIIMNFSSMSDVVFKWRLQGFIESLSKYFRFETTDAENRKLVCCSEEINSISKVKLNIVRSDTNPSSNYVMCSRICQQLQIADLVVVDVSQRNTNVFYELGIAVALGKLILPICYSESLFMLEVPEILKSLKEEDYRKKLRHIDCFPWRRTLFEYYGIRFRTYDSSSAKENPIGNNNSINDKVKYLKFDTAIKEKYGFSDMQYTRFPYQRDINTSSKTENIGKKLYEILRNSYNNSGRNQNTLVVYTMDGLLNEEQAGLCIVNYYNNITKQMKAQQCFYGDRVGVLIQGNTISEKEKDTQKNRSLLYSVGEIIHIGMNQATYTSQMAQIKPSDYLNISVAQDKNDMQDEIKRFVKGYSRNKSISIYPDHPVYVQRVEKGIQYDLFDMKDLDKDFSHKYFFCLYHIMLQNLKCTNEVVVDISGNSIHALFWLGAAHGSDVYAIAVRHEQTEAESKASSNEHMRPIFDISGLWTAILHYYDTEGFYRQLARVQMGIDQHTKLMVRNPDNDEHLLHETICDSGTGRIEDIGNRNEESAILESYYRSRFWKNMLRYNHLHIYLPQKTVGDCSDLFVEEEYVKKFAKFSRYLSRRTVIGEYDVEIIPENIALKDDINCISMGSVGRSQEATGKPDEKGRLHRYRNVADKWNARAYFHVAFRNTDRVEEQNLSDALIAEPWETGSVAKTYLVDMQLKQRDKFIKRYHDILKENLQDPYPLAYIQYSSEAYLSTVLYRYFLPFITIEEENRILNGMETFMRTLLIDNQNFFPWCRNLSKNSLEQKVLNVVRQTLAKVLAETISLYT